MSGQKNENQIETMKEDKQSKNPQDSQYNKFTPQQSNNEQDSQYNKFTLQQWNNE